ncbi:MAG: sigma-54 dependent transcriptional regulator [Pseudomonadota bacterium]
MSDTVLEPPSPQDLHQPVLLIVDDDAAHLQSLRVIFEREGMRVLSARDGEEAVQVARSERVHVVLTDLVMPRLSGLELLKALRMVAPEAETLLMTAYGTVETAVEAMREGAYDFITKPIKRGVVVQAVRRALEKQALVVENRSLKAELDSVRGSQDIVGISPAIRRLVELIAQVGPTSATVLVLGESGTGKELVARALHQQSPRAQRPFVALNCAALPESILEAELFGVEPGAYTGATERREGRFERADSGTLFLDEIGEMPAHLQVKILRALQEGEIERLGGKAPVKVNVRVIAATNRDLKMLVSEGRFRADLYYRLDVISVLCPPLRERIDDVPVLVDHFLRRFNQRHQKHLRGLDREALGALCKHAWPGNVRELENVIERAVILCQGDVLDRVSLGPSFAGQGDEPPRAGGQLQIPVGSSMADVERRVIEETLRQTGGDKNVAARLLGISTRTIYRRLEEKQGGDAED